jgi:PAS domain S-box-containing protein
MHAIRVQFGLGVSAMTIRKIVLFFFALLVAEIVALGFVLSLVISSQQDLAEIENLRHRAFRVADELRQSSDDLTRMARTYVSTGDPAFEQYFRDILDIRDGEKARPSNYGRIYWDLIAAGIDVPGDLMPAISLDAQMEELNLTAEELMELQAAKENSDALVSLETEAMNAVKGLFNEGGEIVQRVPNLDLARSIMFGADYHAAKAAIMIPVNNFLASLEVRMNTAVAGQRALLSQQQSLAAFVVALILATFGILAIVIRRRVTGPVNLLVAQSEAIRQGDYGKQTEFRSNDEIGILADALNRMSIAIADDIAERKRTSYQLAKQQISLRQSEAQFRSVFETNAAGMALLTIDGSYFKVNQRFCEIVGYPEEELLNMKWRDITHRDDIAAVEALDEQVSDGKRDEFMTERRLVRKDGTIIWTSLSSAQLCDEEGIPHQIFSFVQDTTDVKEAERAIRRIFDTAAEGIWMIDNDGRTTQVNDAMCEMLERSSEEVVGHRSSEFFDTPNKKILRQQLKRRERGESGVYEIELSRPDGSQVPCMFNDAPMLDDMGEKVGDFAMVTDMTTRKRAEASLRESEERYALAMESAGEGLWDWDLQADTLTMSPQFIKLMGLDSKTMTINPEQWMERMHPDDLAGYQHALKAHLSGTAESVRAEFRIGDAEGTYRWVEAQGMGHRNEEGRVYRVAGSVTDITERRNAEKQLRESEARFRALIDNSPSEIVIKDSDLRYVRVNRIFERNYGVANDEIVGKTAHSFLPESMIGPIDDQDRKVMATGVATEIELETAVDGESRFNLESKFPIRDDEENVIGIAGIAADITDKKTAEIELLAAKEQAEMALAELKQTQDRLVTTEKMASLGQLTAGIAHEIKNPLNFVNNFSETSVELLDELKEELEDAVAGLDDESRDDVEDILETLRGDLQKIHHHGGRADSIVKSMLLHARGENTERGSTEINPLIDEALALAYHGERARDKSFQATLEQEFDEAAGEIEMVSQEITRVLVNLLSNAFYAIAERRRSEKGDDYVPTVTVSTKDLGDEVEIRVRDNGTGMPADVREKLFDPFFTTKPTGEGTGLGMSMSFDIVVQQHGGQIDVDSAPGEFTEFKITLPRHSTDGQTHAGNGS